VNLPNRRKPTVWMNVTTTANWDRPAVGIVRVEKELSRELSRLYGEDAFSFCIFEEGEFVPYDGAGDNNAQTFHKPARELAGALSNSASHFPKHLLPRSSTFDHVPKTARWLSRWRKKRPTSIHETTTGFSNAQALRGNEAARSQSVQKQIQHGDIILSVGLDWNYSYTSKFQSLREEKGIKIVTCCYDLIPIIFPQYCNGDVAPYYKDYFTKLSWASSLVLCISRRSRNDYVRFAGKVGAPEVETLVIPLGDDVPDHAAHGEAGSGADEPSSLSTDVQRATEKPFILFVSTIERRKNHETLYRAYHLLARAGHADRLPKLVFVGMPGWGVDNLLKDIELDPLTQGLIVQLNHVSDKELTHLYQKAYFCAYPSLYEGWGLPVGEALAYGKAVIASAQGSIPEVGGDLVTYLDPWNPQIWADEILTLIDHPERIEAMETQVRERYRPRTWRDTAEVVKTGLDRLREQTQISITLYPGYDLLTMTGTPCGQAMRSTGAAGALTHGPYHALPPGTYDIEITMDKLDGDAGMILIALKSSLGAREHASLKIKFDEREHFGVIAKLERVQLDEPIDDYEIYSEITPNLLVSINKIDVVLKNTE
jgi:glycosyltransferase involved in cell wall biosynthesis